MHKRRGFPLYYGPPLTRFTVGLERDPQGPGPPFYTSEEVSRTHGFKTFSCTFMTEIPENIRKQADIPDIPEQKELIPGPTAGVLSKG